MVRRNQRVMGLVVLAALALPAAALALTLRAAARGRAAGRAMPAASTSRGVPAVGALYASARASQHGCTAAVVHSASANMLVTAAHCVVGRGAGMVFVPGQDGAREPFGRWIVTAAYVERRWEARQDPDGDVAFLTVAPHIVDGVRTEIEQVTGAYTLGATAVAGQRVTVIGYPAGGANDPITCTNVVYLTAKFPSFDCRGFVDGTSGSPWLRTTRRGTAIVGLIGGPNQGGCHDYTSYSAELRAEADTAYARASGDRSPDVAPQPRGDGC
jgi:V8-like Glu-specific endopeptidase